MFLNFYNISIFLNKGSIWGGFSRGATMGFWVDF